MFTRSTRFSLVLVLGLSLLALSSACGHKADNKTAKKDGDKTPTKPYVSKGDEGTITGSVAYNGTPPAPKKIDTSADPVCASKNPNLETDDTKVTNGKLANVFVYIKEGKLADGSKIADYAFAVPATPVVLDQNGCHYVPHVLGIQANQTLKVTNSDPTQHNVHPGPQINEEWNQSQAQGAAPILNTFTRVEVLIPVKCNQHPWMKSYIGVLKHPYYDVSAADGSFTIKGVPPGTYTVGAWHEGPGKGTEQTKQVTVAAKGSATTDFAFGTATASSGQSSLEMMPAIEFPMLGKH
jgi:Polysaccharide lyase family 4, domain II